MTRRIKRNRDFDITLEIHNHEFIRPPRDAQRNWLLNRAIKEFSDDLQYLDCTAQQFVKGSDTTNFNDRTHAELSDEEIMEDWQIPVMQAMAEVATSGGGDILEIGFGRGIASALLQERDIRSHTIVECNEGIFQRAKAWRQQYADREINLVKGLWQNVIDDLGLFNGIFFHTYPLNEEEYVDLVAQSTTFAEHFFATAAEHLNPGGRFTYLSNESDSLSRGHQRALFEHFSSIALRRLEELPIPSDTRDAQWQDSLVIITAIR